MGSAFHQLCPIYSGTLTPLPLRLLGYRTPLPLPYMEIAVHLAVTCDVSIDTSLFCPFSHEMSWMRSGTKLGRFLRVFLPTFGSGKLKTS